MVRPRYDLKESHLSKMSLHAQDFEILRDTASNYFRGLYVRFAAGGVAYLQFAQSAPI
jgi:hypothetical protein